MNQNNDINPTKHKLSIVSNTSTISKTSLSAFIQEIQQTTERLLSQMFNFPSSQNMKKLSQNRILLAKQQQSDKNSVNMNSTNSSINYQQPISNDFLQRSKYLQRERKRKIEMLRQKKQEQLIRQHTYKPNINKNANNTKSIQKRIDQIQRSKQKLLYEKRTQLKIKQDKQFNSFSFQPKINSSKNTQHNFQQFYHKKLQWQAHKLQEIQKSKQLEQMRQMNFCKFKPVILTTQSKYYKQNCKKNKKTKVEDRLIKNFESSLQKKYHKNK